MKVAKNNQRQDISLHTSTIINNKVQHDFSLRHLNLILQPQIVIEFTGHHGAYNYS